MLLSPLPGAAMSMPHLKRRDRERMLSSASSAEETVSGKEAIWAMRVAPAWAWRAEGGITASISAPSSTPTVSPAARRCQRECPSPAARHAAQRHLGSIVLGRGEGTAGNILPGHQSQSAPSYTAAAQLYSREPAATGRPTKMSMSTPSVASTTFEGPSPRPGGAHCAETGHNSCSR